ncbi:hypothetical protein [Pedobacter sp. MR22-3]|uniref:hypothetical protein n=1 Tax=Pedobacter sp. MR22-3 TaxID=2994552 RepID=UPI002245B27D|nr:hypothetical protein [Pedobacter sp. MR22-3]MCX2582479.1 hypothetical protein [Pedobacter sp. MR22-3]
MKIKNIGHLAVLLIPFISFSCKKDNSIQVIDIPIEATEVARIKYFNFTAGSPSVNFYANGVKVSGILSNTGSESTAGTAYGAVYPASNYSVINPATYKINGIIPSTATANANVTISEVNSNLEKGKYYSLYTGGIYNSATKTAESFILEDVLPPNNASNMVAYVRFVNAIPNGNSPMTLVIKNAVSGLETVVATGIAYKAGSVFVPVPIGSYELYVRYSASGINIISRNGTTNGVVPFLGGRTYTVGARGDITITSATAATRPLIDNTANQ